jgi:hypothetical protein
VDGFQTYSTVSVFLLTSQRLARLPLFTSMENPDQFVKRAEYARMRGWDRSYVTKLERQGRVVLSGDGKKVDWAATDAKIGKTADPSKVGVQQRWAEERVQRNVYDGIHAPAPEAADPPAAPVADSSFQQARASREHYNGQMARLEYEWLTGLLVSRPRVEDAAHTIGRALRDRMLGMGPRIAPELAAISDPWELEKRLTEALRQVLDDVAAFGVTIMRDVNNDPARGKLAELSRVGRERYGSDRDKTAAS